MCISALRFQVFWTRIKLLVGAGESNEKDRLYYIYTHTIYRYVEAQHLDAEGDSKNSKHIATTSFSYFSMNEFLLFSSQSTLADTLCQVSKLSMTTLPCNEIYLGYQQQIGKEQNSGLASYGMCTCTVWLCVHASYDNIWVHCDKCSVLKVVCLNESIALLLQMSLLLLLDGWWSLSFFDVNPIQLVYACLVHHFQLHSYSHPTTCTHSPHPQCHCHWSDMENSSL